ncbi:MAG: IS5 family transposase [Leptolyngbyaceae cyanobacterium]
MGQQGFWDVQTRQQKLERKKDLLNRLNQMVPWESFRPTLKKVRDKPRKSKAGRKPLDEVLLFKMLVLQRLYNISDEDLEYQVNDRLSFMQFLNLGLEDRVPDATTVWLFREQLQQQELVEALFEQFESYLQQAGYQAKDGQIMDATLVPVPKQRNGREENKQIKSGQMPEEWSQQPHKRAQKDIDARWTKKNNVSHFGYKDNISIDEGFGFIRRYVVTDASVHDSQVLSELLDIDNPDERLWADSAYRSEARLDVLEWMGFEPLFNERAYRNAPLTDEQKAANRERSKTRAKVEHVFGSWVSSSGGKLLRTIGIARAKTNLGLQNLVYNFKRLILLKSQATSADIAG